MLSLKKEEEKIFNRFFGVFFLSRSLIYFLAHIKINRMERIGLSFAVFFVLQVRE
jgi:hypothetical protein